LIDDAYMDGIKLEDGVIRFILNQSHVDGTTVGNGVALSTKVPLITTQVDTKVIGSYIRDCEQDCICAEGIMLGFIIQGNFCDGTGTTGLKALIVIQNKLSIGVIVEGNVLTNAPKEGLVCGAKDIVVSNNHVEDFATIGIRIETLQGPGTVTAGIISNNVVAGGASAVKGIFCFSAIRLALTGNIVRGNFSSHGIEVEAQDLTINGNLVSGFVDAGIFITLNAPSIGGCIVGNTIIGISPGSSVQGIQLEAVEEYAINGNRITECGKGIIESGASDFNAIVGNVVRGNTTPITVVGASTIQANNVL